MQFADIRVEWRVNDIESKLYQKAESYRVEQVSSNVDSLERSLREACSCIDGLRYALEATLERVERLENTIQEMSDRHESGD